MTTFDLGIGWVLYGKLFVRLFQPAVSNENVRKHLLRLMWYVHQHMSQERLDTILEAVEPDKDVGWPSVPTSRLC